MSTPRDATGPAVGVSRHRRLSRKWRVVVLAATVACVTLAVYQVFNLGFWLGYTALENQLC